MIVLLGMLTAKDLIQYPAEIAEFQEEIGGMSPTRMIESSWKGQIAVARVVSSA